MITLIIILILLILALLILPFTKALIQDKQDLRMSPIEERFKVLIDEINNAFLDGKGTVNYPDPNDNRNINLFSDKMANYLIQFFYSTGHLTIYMNYKYLQKELNEKVVFYNMKSADFFTQKRMANEFIQKMGTAILAHQKNIRIPDTSNSSTSANVVDNNDPTDLLSSMYNGLTMHQKKSIINMGYLIYTANGSSWADFLDNAAVRPQLNYLNLDWKDCKSQLDAEGEDSVYRDLSNLEDGVYDSLLMFWLAIVSDEFGPVNSRADKFISMNERLGHSEKDIEERVMKIQAMMKLFG